jgi:hypothetical protein
LDVIGFGVPFRDDRGRESLVTGIGHARGVLKNDLVLRVGFAIRPDRKAPPEDVPLVRVLGHLDLDARVEPVGDIRIVVAIEGVPVGRNARPGRLDFPFQEFGFDHRLFY